MYQTTRCNRAGAGVSKKRFKDYLQKNNAAL
jgi:hypothetical protein